MRKKRYWTIQKFSLRYACFMFFDTDLYLAIFCHVRKKTRRRFWMLRGVKEEIRSFMDEMEQTKGDDRQNEVHTDCKAKQARTA